MGNIYLIRHGFTPANNANYNNQRGLSQIAFDENMPLDKVYGISQALELGIFLNGIMGNSLILVSPYKRTRETLEYALQNMNGEYEIKVIDDLKEINTGVCYAKTRDEVIEENDGALEFFDNLEKSPLSTSYIGGESEYDVRDRVIDISSKILEFSKIYDNIFVFAHGSVNKWIFYNINGYFYDYQKNCEVIKASGDDRGTSLFVPIAWAPNGYMVDTNDFISQKQYSKRLSTKNG
ncbi:MAG: histidine phosphatase family protein [Bacilli bacterium]|nr:histidine phosphatase family protein [Bacilli bacterium]